MSRCAEKNHFAWAEIGIVGVGPCGIDVVCALARQGRNPAQWLCAIDDDPAQLERAIGTQRFVAVEQRASAKRNRFIRPHHLQVRLPDLDDLAIRLRDACLIVVVADIDARPELARRVAAICHEQQSLTIGIGVTATVRSGNAGRDAFVQVCPTSFWSEPWPLLPRLVTTIEDGVSDPHRSDVIALVSALVDPLHALGPIGFSYDDLAVVVGNSDCARFAVASDTGPDRSLRVARQLVAAAKTGENSLATASNLYLSVFGGEDMTLHEINAVAVAVHDATNDDANIIFNSVVVDQKAELTAVLCWG